MSAIPMKNPMKPIIWVHVQVHVQPQLTGFKSFVDPVFSWSFNANKQTFTAYNNNSLQ